MSVTGRSSRTLAIPSAAWKSAVVISPLAITARQTRARSSRSRGSRARTRIGLSGPLGWLAAHTLHPHGHGFGWGTSSLAHEAEDAVRSAGALALLTAPQKQDATFLLAGQAYERLALKATTFGLAQQPLSAAIESEPHRAVLARAFGAAGEDPLLLVRLGRAHPVPPTARRTVALVSTYRTS